MRSTEEMKRAVHREAAHRKSRRRAVLSGGVAALTLVLITAAVARAGTGGGSAEVTTADDGAAPTSASSTTAATTPGPTTPGTIVVVDESGETIVITEGDGSVVSGPRSTTTRPPSGPDPTSETGPTTSDPATPTTAGGPTPTQPDPTTTQAPATTAPTTQPTRLCTPADIIRAPLQVYVPTWPGSDIPAGHVVQFGYSTLARSDITPCRTLDSLQVLTVTDANGSEVFRHTNDGGPGRVITPGAWVMFRGSVSWDPSCQTPIPPPFVGSCVPVGPGSYNVHLSDQGVVYPTLQLTITAAR